MPNLDERIQRQIKNTILVVGDDKADHEFLTSIFDPEHYAFLHRFSVDEGYRTLLESKDIITLVVLDMPEDSEAGFRFLRLKKENVGISSIPLVVITQQNQLEVECLSLGASHFILKPFESKEVVRARIENILSLHRKNRIIQKTREDEVTGLLNPDYFILYASELLHGPGEFDMISIRLSSFTILSELFPRERCYDLLRSMAKVLQQIAAENGGFAARGHADLFYLIIPAQEKYEWIIKAIRKAIITDELKDLKTKVKLGIYQKVNKKLTVNTLIQISMKTCAAILNLETESIAFYDEIQHRRELFNQELINDFEDAIKEKQFEVYLQPKYNIHSHRPVLDHAEALVRWNNPRLGFVSPGDFIPLFEENGLIEELDRYVFVEVASLLREMLDEFGDETPNVSVNLSRIDFFDPAILEKMKNALDAHNVPYSYVNIEVTESAYIKGGERLVAKIAEIRNAGFKIEIDDFGSGYSTLNMLSVIPFDALKIDMIFMKHFDSSPGVKSIIKAIVDIARSLKAEVVCEGVETRKQYDFLKSLGVDYVQGFYLSKPLPYSGFKTLLRDDIEKRH